MFPSWGYFCPLAWGHYNTFTIDIIVLRRTKALVLWVLVWQEWLVRSSDACVMRRGVPAGAAGAVDAAGGGQWRRGRRGAGGGSRAPTAPATSRLPPSALRVRWVNVSSRYKSRLGIGKAHGCRKVVQSALMRSSFIPHSWCIWPIRSSIPRWRLLLHFVYI